MNRILLFIFIFSTALALTTAAQDITGIWRGYFITEDFHQYRFEVQIEHSKNNILSGVTYSYLDKQFYGKSSMTGHFKKTDSMALIQEIKTLEVRMSPLSHTCIQKCLLTYIKSGREEFLEGTFTSMIEKTDSMRGVKRGEDCGGGTMYLRKVTTSDFYVEPFLRKRLTPDIKTPPLVKNDSQQPNKTPETNTTTTQPKKNTTAGNRTNTNSNKTVVTVKPKTDSVTKMDITAAKPDEKNILVKPNIKIPDILQTRENSLVKTLQIKSDHVIVKLYDNGEIDDDTISVYLDNQLILSKKRLSATAITINLKMDESNPEHELVMVAENLGRIPPNTSLMIVTAGEQRYEVRITSTGQKNAMVRFRYSKPLP